MTGRASAISTPSVVVLFTDSYPFDAALEATFIEPELPHLAALFDEVVLVPGRTEGHRVGTGMEIRVDESLARALRAGRTRRLLRALRFRPFWHDLLATPALRSRRSLWRLMATAGRAGIVHDWLKDQVAGGRLVPSTTVAYTYWCDDDAVAIAEYRRREPELIAVSRAHNYDLYAERYDPPYIPCREQTLAGLNALLPDSQRGADYIAERYPRFSRRVEVARLGVPDPGFATKPSQPGDLIVASCSHIVPVKRVELIARSIVALAERRPDITVEWHHIGDGPGRISVESVITGFPPNARATLHGQLQAREMYEVYRDTAIDVFVNASTFEGTPVSVMEAASCSIPIVATAAGGNVELVSDANGRLVDLDPTPHDLAEAILGIGADKANQAAKAIGSRSVWESRYSADRTSRAFAQRLQALAATPRTMA